MYITISLVEKFQGLRLYRRFWNPLAKNWISGKRTKRINGYARSTATCQGIAVDVSGTVLCAHIVHSGSCIEIATFQCARRWRNCIATTKRSHRIISTDFTRTFRTMSWNRGQNSSHYLTKWNLPGNFLRDFSRTFFYVWALHLKKIRSNHIHRLLGHSEKSRGTRADLIPLFHRTW
ncbi:hypothetical protein SUGI_0360300 [Cryptomeria japonica]|nr:hypothetical protein SUGI_0360300 [Cryptomeria japonica]